MEASAGALNTHTHTHVNITLKLQFVFLAVSSDAPVSPEAHGDEVLTL